MKQLNLLIEELKSINKRPDNIHYTNLKGLYGILFDGKLLPNEYSYSTHKGKLEISTIRRSRDKVLSKGSNELTRRKSSLSQSAGDVKIYLFSDRILSSVRGVRKTPVSEFGMEDLESFDFICRDIHDLVTPKEEFKEFKPKIISFLKSLSPIIDNITNFNDRKNLIAKEIAKFIEKHTVVRKRRDDELFGGEREMASSVIDAYDLLVNNSNKQQKINREAEERFQFKNRAKRKDGIPVEHKFMKIRIEDSLRDEMRKLFDTKDEYEEYSPEELLKNMKEYRSVFVVDRYYNETIKELENYAKERVDE